jgi:predicted metal-binding protein
MQKVLLNLYVKQVQMITEFNIKLDRPSEIKRIKEFLKTLTSAKVTIKQDNKREVIEDRETLEALRFTSQKNLSKFLENEEGGLF